MLFPKTEYRFSNHFMDHANHSPEPQDIYFPVTFQWIIYNGYYYITFGFLAAVFPGNWNGVLLPEKAVRTHGSFFYERVQKQLELQKIYIYNVLLMLQKVQKLELGNNIYILLNLSAGTSNSIE